MSAVNAGLYQRAFFVFALGVCLVSCVSSQPKTETTLAEARDRAALAETTPELKPTEVANVPAPESVPPALPAEVIVPMSALPADPEQTETNVSDVKPEDAKVAETNPLELETAPEVELSEPTDLKPDEPESEPIRSTASLPVDLAPPEEPQEIESAESLFELVDKGIEKMRPVEDVPFQNLKTHKDEMFEEERVGLEVWLEAEEPETNLSRLLKKSEYPEVVPKAFRRKGSVLNRYYFVRKNDTPFSIAELIYGDTKRKRELARWNYGHWDPGRLLYYASPFAPKDTKMLSFFEERNATANEVVMGRNDCLPTVARKVLGNEYSWREIAFVNNIDDRDFCKPGFKLKVFPADLSQFTKIPIPKLETPEEDTADPIPIASPEPKKQPEVEKAKVEPLPVPLPPVTSKAPKLPETTVKAEPLLPFTAPVEVRQPTSLPEAATLLPKIELPTPSPTAVDKLGQSPSQEPAAIVSEDVPLVKSSASLPFKAPASSPSPEP